MLDGRCLLLSTDSKAVGLNNCLKADSSKEIGLCLLGHWYNQQTVLVSL